MDWNVFVDLVSPTRLVTLVIALAITTILGVVGALKAKQFRWAAIAKCLEPSGNFLAYIVGYVIVAGLGAFILPDAVDATAVVAAYTIIIGAMVLKVKEQLAYLVPGLPVVNWKLPFESRPN